jgi:hypothetical protein
MQCPSGDKALECAEMANWLFAEQDVSANEKI